MNKLGLLALSLGIIAAVAVAPADAQTVKKNATEKVRWYSAPRQIQILDDSPVVRDFREAPQASQDIQLPPGPGAGSGYSGGGAGALGGDNGGTIPAGGLPIGGGGGPGYRTSNGPGGLPLPKADFAHAQTNIPARGMGPKGPLPGGFTTGIHGKVNPWSGPSVNSPRMGMGRATPTSRPSAPVQAASYNNGGGGYGPSVGSGTGGGGGGSSTSVSARLLKKVR